MTKVRNSRLGEYMMMLRSHSQGFDLRTADQNCRRMRISEMPAIVPVATERIQCAGKLGDEKRVRGYEFWLLVASHERGKSKSTYSC
jgi:hypothetical protein